MYCSNCGKENSDEAKFCSGCGSPLQTQSAETKAETTMATESEVSSDSTPLKIICPECGSRHLTVTNEVNIKSSGGGFSGAKGCLGYFMFGPLGILCGSCGQKQKTTSTNTTYWICNDCGNKFKHYNVLENELKLRKYLFIFLVIITALQCISIVSILVMQVLSFVICGYFMNTNDPLELLEILCLIPTLLACVVLKVDINKRKKAIEDYKQKMKKFQ